MLCQTFGTEYRTMLPARTAEKHGKMSKTSLRVHHYTIVYQGINIIQKTQNIASGKQKISDGLVFACKLLVFGISTGVMYSPTVEYVTTAIARIVVRNAAFFIRKTLYLHSEPVCRIPCINTVF